MYSEKVLAALKGIDAESGDTIEISGEGMKISGTLMPRPDLGDTDILVIKLENGYNIGIRFSEKQKLRKISGKKEMQHAEPPPAKSRQAKEHVDLLYTGGTIGSKVDYLTGGVYMLTTPEELLGEVPEISEIATINVKNLMSIASEDMSYMEWQKIALAAEESFNAGASGVVITHGTDTMHYTAAALSFMLSGIKGPVVLTGAQRSSDRGSSDAFQNLFCSISFASTQDIGEVGICMHETSSDNSCVFIRGTHARKMHTSRRDAFRAINEKPLARIHHDGKIDILSNEGIRPPSSGNTRARTGFEPKVAMIKMHPNSDPGVMEYYISKKFRGIIIEGTGLGHAPVSTPHKEYNWLDQIRAATDSGTVVAVTSQCINGRVSDKVYRNLRLMKSAGAIFCEDMLSEVAYVKLGWLLGNNQPKEAARLMPVNIAGEISTRSRVNWF